jgi:hypothetical protein
MKQTKKTILAVIILSSCRTSGYGCKGNESWGKMVRRINS